MTGTVFDIRRFSTHDGEGIRTTVFMKGCPLRCVWCHNPEGIDTRSRPLFFQDRCIGCGTCRTYGLCYETLNKTIKKLVNLLNEG